MRTCALCEEPLTGRFCERCYPQFARPPLPEGPVPVPVVPHHSIDPGRVARAVLVSGLLVLAAAAGYLAAWSLWGGAEHAATGPTSAAALASHREHGEFQRWEPGDRVVVDAEILDRERLGGDAGILDEAGPWFLQLAPDGSGIVVLDVTEVDLRGHPRVRFTLNVVERPNLRTGAMVVWFAEDRNGDLPGTVILAAEDVALSR